MSLVPQALRRKAVGWIRDPDELAALDMTEQRFGAPSARLPDSVRHKALATILDQRGQSCTGHGLAQAMVIAERVAWMRARPGSTPAQAIAACPMPSPYFAYYNGRRQEGTGPKVQDRGAFPRYGATGISELGLCALADWNPQVRVNMTISAVDRKPSLEAYSKGFKRKHAKFYRVTSHDDERGLAVRAAVAAGKGVGFGTQVAESLFDRSGARIVDRPDNEPSAGLHYMCITGYQRSAEHEWLYDVAQSYSPYYRDSGHFQITQRYLAWRMTSDILFLDDWEALHEAARV